ncbi:MAG: response regulator [Gemmatimonadaceae bacterium]
MSPLPLGVGPTNTTHGRPPGLRVLVVDDEDPVRRVLSRWFTRHGFDVSEAANGDQARLWLSSSASESFDLVVCDVRMPELSGPELYEWLAAYRPQVIPKLVFTTGDRLHDGVREFLLTTPCAVLDKPFELPALEDVVRRVTLAKVTA